MNILDIKDDPRRLNTVTVDHDKCMGCMSCMRVCCYDVYEWDPVERLSTAAYPEECVNCYQCMYYCPAGAIQVTQSELAFYDPLYDPFGLNDPKEAANE